MRMKGLRALWATAARRLRTQQIRELQQAARRLAGAEPDHLRAGPVPGVVERKRAFICVNTLRANTVVKEALQAQRLPALAGYESLKSEVKYGAERSRIDFMLQASDKVNCYIEVKSVTLSEQDSGYFPDAVTARGQKHLRELMSVVEQGDRAVLLFAVLHSAITQVAPARHIDERYAELLSEAQRKGVEVLAWKASLSASEITLTSPLPVRL